MNKIGKEEYIKEPIQKRIIALKVVRTNGMRKTKLEKRSISEDQFRRG